MGKFARVKLEPLSRSLLAGIPAVLFPSRARTGKRESERGRGMCAGCPLYGVRVVIVSERLGSPRDRAEDAMRTVELSWTVFPGRDV